MAERIDGLPGFDGAEELAAKYAAKHAAPDAAIKALILSQTALAGSAGLLTGIGGFVSLPVAIPANLASALYIQVRLIAAIAHLRGHDIRTPEVRGLVLACLTGSKAADTLKNAGARSRRTDDPRCRRLDVAGAGEKSRAHGRGFHAGAAQKGRARRRGVRDGAGRRRTRREDRAKWCRWSAALSRPGSTRR